MAAHKPDKVLSLREQNHLLFKQKEKSKSRSYWEPEHGWLTKKELDYLNKKGSLHNIKTKDEILRGYRLTQEKWKEVSNGKSKVEQHDGEKHAEV